MRVVTKAARQEEAVSGGEVAHGHGDKYSSTAFCTKMGFSAVPMVVAIAAADSTCCRPGNPTMAGSTVMVLSMAIV
jgi:hypothetical protein